jgi:hypothetical protein
MNTSNYTRHDLVKAYNNGYPSFIGKVAYTGFESFEEAQALATELGGEIHKIYYRDGQSLPESRGRVWAAFTASDYVNDLGENYSIETVASVTEALADCDEDRRDELEYILSECSSAKENEVVVTGYGKYYETIPATMMSYHEDVHNYEIGVVVENQTEDEDDAE